MAVVDLHSPAPEPDDDDVFDVDALVAEAGRKPFRFKFGGETYVLPPSPPLKVVDALSGEQDPAAMTTAMILLMGPEQWRRLLASDANLDAPTMTAIMDKYAAHGGMTVPNLSGSTGPSKSTVQPSKRTSNGSTKSRSRGSQTAR